MRLGVSLKSAVALVFYPVAAILFLTAPYLFLGRTWRTPCVVGLIVFVLLMALLPNTLEAGALSNRVTLPLCAYLGGLAAAGVVAIFFRRES